MSIIYCASYVVISRFAKATIFQWQFESFYFDNSDDVSFFNSTVNKATKSYDLGLTGQKSSLDDKEQTLLYIFFDQPVR